MAAVFQGNKSPFFGWLEAYIYDFCKIDPKKEMDWRTYAKALLSFNFIGLLFLFLLLSFQDSLPLNSQKFAGMRMDLAFNTAVSFVTNTNWQAYGGEVTLSNLSQMVGLTVQNFLSASTGNAALLALIRGLSRRSVVTIGNFWVDLIRSILYLFLPFAFLFALILVSQGVIQTFSSNEVVKTISGEAQIIPMGPVASQVAIKQLGTNGGGFFNANSAHPFENPTPLSNFLEVFAILCIPAASTYMFGVMIRDKKQGWILFFVMSFFWMIGLGISWYSEKSNNIFLGENPVFEGKETRFGLADTVLWAMSTTATSNGSVNSMHDSLSPLAGGMAMFNMMIGEVVFGGVGVGLSGMLMFAILTVFLAGLMVGRTPEYLGKKIEKSEMQWVMLAILAPCALILVGSGLALSLPMALDSLLNHGPHGLTEILYAFSSAAGNNGSAFAGLNADTVFFNIVLGVVMLLSRLAIILASLGIAGGLVQKRKMLPSIGTFPTDDLQFAILLSSVIFIVAALTFFPALSLGPIIEQMLMLKGKGF